MGSDRQSRSVVGVMTYDQWKSTNPADVYLGNEFEDEETNMDTYHIRRHPTKPEALGCIDICESEDDGGWYAMEYDFTRKDNATRVSRGIYPTKIALIRALDSEDHRWGEWD